MRLRGNESALRHFGLRLLRSGETCARNLRGRAAAPPLLSRLGAEASPRSSIPALSALSSSVRSYPDKAPGSGRLGLVRAMASKTTHTEPFKLAMCQLQVTADKDANIASASKAVREAASNGAQVVILPEMWNCPYSNDSFPVYAEDLDSEDSPSTQALSTLAKDLSVYIIGGSIPERQKDRLYNTCCVFDPRGEVVARYRKCHLFDIDIPGKITFKESDTLTCGDSLTVVETEHGKIGLGICYDLRFPELAMIYAKRGVQLIVYPGAFNMVTGPVHWQLLQQARAGEI